MIDAVNPEKILHDLHELWDQLGQDQKSAGGVLRACSMTLVVVAEDEADCEQVRRTVGVLMHDHPSRAIVLRAKECVDVEARVFAECWMPTGGSRQICAEGVEISGGADRWSEVARVLAPLLVPDLPVVLWCRGSRAFSSRSFEPLFSLAGKIIVDSDAAPEANAALVLLRHMEGRRRRVADLAWTRLTGWRETVSNAFDDGLLPLSSIASVRIAHGGSKPPSCALYFSSWIKRAMPSARVAIETVPGEHGLQAIAFSGAGSEIAISRVEGSSVEVRSGTRRFRSLLPSASEDALMREELSILEADPVFDMVVGG